MASAQKGNGSDYRRLLEELTRVIRNFLRSRFGPHDFIEDCVQEILISIHHARHTYNPKRPFRPWLFAIVRNKAIDFLRHERSSERTLDRFRREQQVLEAHGNHGNHHEFSEGRLLESLSATNRQALVLTKIIGFSVSETAARLGISESAVKVRVHRAVSKLKRLLEDDRI